MSDTDESEGEVYRYTSSKSKVIYKRSRPSITSAVESDYRSADKDYKSADKDYRYADKDYKSADKDYRYADKDYRTADKGYAASDTDESLDYRQTSRWADDQDSLDYKQVSRWAVDYNNRNYIRSLCNKNLGLHRQVKGRPQKWKVQYDNNHFIRSKVNAPKGLHRKRPEIKRKYVPDDDVLADAEGWELEWGPEIDQVEQDVLYIPEGKGIIRRGCYRWYGVNRNDSDYDIKLEEDDRENLLTEEMEEELKYGHEFLQSDIPFLEEQKNRRYTKGGYRFNEVLRNTYDFQSEEAGSAPRDAEWRRKYHCNGLHYLDMDICDCDRDDRSEPHYHGRKGKPFRRTIFNKVYELKKIDSSKDLKRPTTRLSLVPGEGSKTVYEGVSDRYRHFEKFQTKRSPSIRSVFKKKTQKYTSAREDDEYEEYEKEEAKRTYTEMRPEYEERVHRTAEVRHERRRSDEELHRNERGNRRYDEYSTYRDDDRHKRRVSADGSDTDVKKNFETWKEQALYDKEEDESGHRTAEKKSKERRKEKIFEGRDYDYPSKDKVERKSKEKHHDRKEHHLQRGTSSVRDRNHGNQIHKQTKADKVKSKPRDHSRVSTRSQHVSNRSKNIREADSFAAELVPGKKQVLKKLPPHIEERIRNIQERMEKKMELDDRKHKGRRDIHESSSDEHIDLMKHKGHPKDRGETHNTGYEKYITESGSEVWVKKDEKYAELHHKSHR